LLLGLAVSLLLAACARAAQADPSDPEEGETPAAPVAAATAGDTVERSPELRPEVTVEPPGEVRPPAGADLEFRTDFSRHSVEYADILPGGPPKDGIPAIDRPQFETVEQADEWLEPLEPVVFFQAGVDARAYPLQILTWHEIVNDVVGGESVLISFCPLCNTAIAFDRKVEGRVLDFGTTGRLRYSTLFMYDRQTETWWQQASGEAIAGELTGTQLGPSAGPDHCLAGQGCLSCRTSAVARHWHSRPYGQNPCVGYDDINSSPFLYRGPATPGRLPPMARVLAVELGGDVIAFPYETLQTLSVVNAQVGGEEIVVLWEAGTASALDSASLALGRDVGTAAAYSRSVDGRILTFAFDGSSIHDQDTGSRWDVLGHAGEWLAPAGRWSPSTTWFPGSFG
jgi:hypothetical protein